MDVKAVSSAPPNNEYLIKVNDIGGEYSGGSENWRVRKGIGNYYGNKHSRIRNDSDTGGDSLARCVLLHEATKRASIEGEQFLLSFKIPNNIIYMKVTFE